MVHSHFSENDIVTCCIYKLAYRQSKCRLPQTFVDFLGCGVEKGSFEYFKYKPVTSIINHISKKLIYKVTYALDT